MCLMAIQPPHRVEFLQNVLTVRINPSAIGLETCHRKLFRLLVVVMEALVALASNSLASLSLIRVIKTIV